MRTFSALFSLFPFLLFSQSGPAGVGSSTNNSLWLKADAGSSSTVNGSAISFWNDQSGNGIHVTQTLAAQQPSFATNVLNGFPAIQFDNVNGPNVNDKLIGPDSPLLDNTSGYSFFMVTRPQNVDNNARVIVSKRTGVAINQSFMQFFFTGNRFYTDIQSNNERYNTVATFTANNNFLIDQFYDGTLAMASRCRTYVNGTLDVTSGETNTLVPDNVSPLVIGSTDATDPRPFGGYISEIIIYRTALNDASRIIVDNYLSAKYNITLLSNDKYQGDTPANGDFDYDVCGVGQESSGSSTSFSSSISGGFGLSVNSGLDNGDYILAGHNSFTNDATYSDVGGMTGALNARWTRVWYVDVSNALSNINVNLEFDLSDGGVGAISPGPASDYKLLYRNVQTGNWTELSTASSVSGDKIIFSGITLTNDGYYTIGTHQFNASPLPVELLFFEATVCKSGVCLQWATASEKNADYFSIERSKNGIDFEFVAQIKAAGNSAREINYLETDFNPLDGISYYRLKQFDKDDALQLILIRSIDFREEGTLYVFPNPNSGEFNLNLNANSGEEVLVVIVDAAGKQVYSKVILKKDGENYLGLDLTGSIQPGLYWVLASSRQKFYRSVLLIK
ncbi:MAG: T9SS type A sorting domain-containing protein [Bacteroidia bacterium]|jgi:hypothetical protein|nr:T9SS type A sorting domain-containing protein [Bacteroidia bacterium]